MTDKKQVPSALVTRENILILQHELLNDISAWEFTSDNDMLRYMFYVEGIKHMSNKILDYIKANGEGEIK